MAAEGPRLQISNEAIETKNDYIFIDECSISTPFAPLLIAH